MLIVHADLCVDRFFLWGETSETLVKHPCSAVHLSTAGSRGRATGGMSARGLYGLRVLGRPPVLITPDLPTAA